jgi:hypothetical protein
MAEIELHADQKEQENQSDLTEHRKHYSDVRIEDHMKQMGRKVSEQGRAENKARCDLATDLGLADRSEQSTKKARRRDDCDQLNQDVEENMFHLKARSIRRTLNRDSSWGLLTTTGDFPLTGTVYRRRFALTSGFGASTSAPQETRVWSRRGCRQVSETITANYPMCLACGAVLLRSGCGSAGFLGSTNLSISERAKRFYERWGSSLRRSR